ncbi:hypothetical protein RJ639_012970 [Escallonia herrerae]|uniref:RNase H type-1 domain-containing protein n=1 Tax=Escallonia herrerae TaxID=1293975 RepID=A0AA88VPB1_9ASTE|nr:hypothetical protein RJ639_012970 [Escallonia herrerae]
MPQCDLYDGTGDPREHVYQFETNMLLLQVSDAVMCRAFPTILRKAAHAWFKSLHPRSVYSFGQLSDLFQKHFVSSSSRWKNSASLLNVVQEKNESLACFLRLFNSATLEIENLDEFVKYIAFLRGLQSTSKFAFSMNKIPPDLKDVKTPHDDPLVITIKAGNFEVKCVLVDNGSSIEILFYDAFKKMNISMDRLRKMDTPLYGFSNHPVAVEGPLCIQRHIRTTNTQSITGCGINLPPQDEIPYEIRDQRDERRLDYSLSVLRDFMPIEEQGSTHYQDLREDTKMQRGEPVKNLVRIEVYPKEEDKTVRIGLNLKEDTKLELVNLLKTYADVFAWTAVDKPGIDPEVITHRKIDPWNLYVDGSSTVGSSGTGIILISPEGFTIEYALRFSFQASNNEAEYEALLTGIRLAHALKVDSLSVYSDSQLMVNHVLGDYEARDERMAQYLELVKTSAVKFKNFTIHQIPQEADTLSRLAFAEATDVRRSVYLEFLKDRSISSQTEIGIIDQEPYWMDTIIKFLSTGELPSERHEARNLHVKAARYTLVEGVLYKKSVSLPYLRCLRLSESIYASQEVHEGI